MATKLQLITELSERTVLKLTNTYENWTVFLRTAAWNYKYTFAEQVLIHAQRPDATACAPIELWNEKLQRWVKKGAKGIALIDDSREKLTLRYVFDIADTNSRSGEPVYLWNMQPRYEEAVAEALENAFGELRDKVTYTDALISATGNLVDDNLTDYLAELMSLRSDSFLEELDDLNVEASLKRVLKPSVAYMLLSRCGIDATDYFRREDFESLWDFNTLPVISLLGSAVSDISEMALREIGSTVHSMHMEESRTEKFALSQNNTLRDQLLDSSPREIIDSAYQIVIKQDILLVMEENDLSEAQLHSLSELECPLDALYHDWLSNDYGHMEQLRNCVTDFTDGILKHNAEQKYADPATPPCIFSTKKAEEFDKMHEWYASHDRDRACKLDYDDGIGKVYNSVEFIPFLQNWTEKYGLDCCVRLLAYTVRKQDYDERYSPLVKNRASYIRFPDGERISDLVSKVHPCIINASMSELIKLEQKRGHIFSIYQLKNGDNLHAIRFESLDRLHEKEIIVSASNYRRVYTAILDSGTTLEDVFEHFNIDNPPDFYGHSLSVSDVVVLRRNGEEHTFYCDSIGFTELPCFKLNEAEQELPEKPKRRETMER